MTKVDGDTVWLRVKAIDVCRQGWQGVPAEGDRARVETQNEKQEGPDGQ